MRRTLVTAATLIVVGATSTACEIAGVLGNGGPEATPATAKPPTRTEAGPGVIPRYPALLSHGTQPKRYTVSVCEGGIDFKQGDVRFRLSYNVEPRGPGAPEFFDRVRSGLRDEGVRAEPYAVKAGEGLVAQVRGFEPFGMAHGDPSPGPEWGDGTYRIYAITDRRGGAKDLTPRTVVSLLVFSPEKKRLTAAHRATAERLMKSIVIDKSSLRVQPKGQIAPVVPVRYERPPGLTGGDQINVYGAQTVYLNYGNGGVANLGIAVRVRFEDLPTDTRSAYQATRRVVPPGTKIEDLTGAPAWIQEGHRVQSRLGPMSSEKYVLWADRMLIELETTDPADSRVMRSLLTSLKPARQI